MKFRVGDKVILVDCSDNILKNSRFKKWIGKICKIIRVIKSDFNYFEVETPNKDTFTTHKRHFINAKIAKTEIYKALTEG